MSLRGRKIRDYDVWGLLGQGGMSELWLAKQSILLVPVVIKTLRPDAMSLFGSTGVARLLQEARLMARIASTRVVRALDAGIFEGSAYVVQEYVDGLDLAELDARRRASLGVGLPLWFVAHVMQDVCKALHAAHQTGVIHRDVKPSNVFGAPEHGVRLGDFGIAIPQVEARGEHEVSGTFRFMSPEQMRGASLDRRTDVYSAGATAFDLRYGTPPFVTPALALDPAYKPTFLRATTPQEAYFQHILGSMLEKNEDRRPRDLLDLARHFRTIDQALRPHKRVTWTRLGPFQYRIGTCEVSFEAGDIAETEADGIVNSSHYHLRMDSGCGLAIARKGGPEIEAESIAHGERPLGSVISTTAGTLRARRVIHAVSAWNEVSCVGRAVHRTFLLADELGLRSLAIPALGTGASRVSMEMCANAIATTLRWHLWLGGSRLQKVRFILADSVAQATFCEVVEQALHGDAAPTNAWVDFGLEANQEVKVDAPTHVAAADRE